MFLLSWILSRTFSYDSALLDRSQEGNQFVKGFGGIGGLLRYKVDFNLIADAMDEDEFYDSDEDYM